MDAPDLQEFRQHELNVNILIPHIINCLVLDASEFCHKRYEKQILTDFLFITIHDWKRIYPWQRASVYHRHETNVTKAIVNKILNSK